MRRSATQQEVVSQLIRQGWEHDATHAKLPARTAFYRWLIWRRLEQEQDRHRAWLRGDDGRYRIRLGHAVQGVGR